MGGSSSPQTRLYSDLRLHFITVASLQPSIFFFKIRNKTRMEGERRREVGAPDDVRVDYSGVHGLSMPFAQAVCPFSYTCMSALLTNQTSCKEPCDSTSQTLTDAEFPLTPSQRATEPWLQAYPRCIFITVFKMRCSGVLGLSGRLKLTFFSWVRNTGSFLQRLFVCYYFLLLVTHPPGKQAQGGVKKNIYTKFSACPTLLNCALS